MPGNKILGIDTSNYTTSVALYGDGEVVQKKKLLPVKPGELGLRQSDAVFRHTQQLPSLMEELMDPISDKIEAIGVSVRPRDQEGSYMPCFTVGASTSRILAAALHIPLFTFSHQAGHIAAALFSAGKLSWLKEENPFLAFHVSGGTTEALWVTPKNGRLQIELAARSLDLKGGQAVDRVGGMLGLPFPSGKYLEELALQSKARFSIRPSMKGANCSLSGVENQCAALIKKGTSKEDVALFCLLSVEAALTAMGEALLKERAGCPILFAGGVMSNSILRKDLTERFDASFAEPAFSADNAAGVAVLAALAMQSSKGGGGICSHL